jgi:hypothetical protein
MFFRQLFDRESCTYTYLIADPDTQKVVLEQKPKAYSCVSEAS